MSAERLDDSLILLEFPQVVERVWQRSETPMGRERVLAMRPYATRDDLLARQAKLQEAFRWASDQRLSLHGAVGLSEPADNAEKGGTLSIDELMALLRTLRVSGQVRHVLGDGAYPALSDDFATWEPPLGLVDALQRVLTDEGEVRDNASPKLREIRQRIRQVEREIDTLFTKILHAGEWSSYLQDTLVTTRFGRRVVPVKNEFRHVVPGIVHDQSGSGQTVFMEPLAAVEKQNQLTDWRSQEAREIERILAMLSGEVGQQAESLRETHRVLAELDDLLASARYGLDTASVIPEVSGETLWLRDARHPLIADPVPIDLLLSPERRVMIVTGPNTGGKTVALKCAGLLAAMALSGLPIPAGEGCVIPFFRKIWVDIGDEQSLEQSLSTFSGHMTRLIPMLEEADASTLCLVDEMGAGTDPDEGAALAEVMIRHFADRGVYLVVSTHFSRLKLLAFKDPRIQNALVEFNRETLSPTYHLVMGQPGSSHAFYIARRLGVGAGLIDEASQLMDVEELKLSDAILEMNQMQQKLRLEEERLKAADDELRLRSQAFDRDRAIWQERLERDRVKAKNAWQREFEELTREFKEVVREVRESEGRERAEALERLRAEFRLVEGMPAALRPPRTTTAARPEHVGDLVRVDGFHEVGTVVELSGRTATVAIGALRIKLGRHEMELVDTPPPAPKARPARTGASHIARDKSLSLVTECDLRGLTQADALDVLDKYLDDAVLGSAAVVRIIHGKGTGALRRAVTDALGHDPRVVSYRLGERGEGGDGVTVVTLEDIDP